MWEIGNNKNYAFFQIFSFYCLVKKGKGSEHLYIYYKQPACYKMKTIDFCQKLVSLCHTCLDLNKFGEDKFLEEITAWKQIFWIPFFISSLETSCILIATIVLENLKVFFTFHIFRRHSREHFSKAA